MNKRGRIDLPFVDTQKAMCSMLQSYMVISAKKFPQETIHRLKSELHFDVYMTLVR